MEERSIYISSVEREKIGRSVTHDFKIKLETTLKLDYNMKNEIALDSLLMTYSWHNINDSYNITTRLNIAMMEEIVGKRLISLMELLVMKILMIIFISIWLERVMLRMMKIKKYPINILFVLSQYRVVVESKDDYQLDLRNGNFSDLLGFDKKILTQTEYGGRLPNITNSNC